MIYYLCHDIVKDVTYSAYGKNILEKIRTTDDVIELLKQKRVEHIYTTSYKMG